jgi:hypothetical protein
MVLKMAVKNEDELTSEEIKKQIADAEKEIAEKQKLKRRLSRKINGVVEREQRLKEDRMKNHAGGMMRMVGLLDYIYPDAELHDNNQDALIENLLVGALLKMSKELSGNATFELQEIYKQGEKFKKLTPQQRVLPGVNSNIADLFDILIQTKRNLSDTKGEQNGHDAGNSNNQD